MPDRHQVAVVVRYVRETATERRTTYYGPFLPHAGSAVSSLIARLDYDASESGRFTYWEAFVESVFIGPVESDATVVAVNG